MGQFIDLTGHKFGRWTVMGKSSDRGNGRKPSIKWLCKCECGNLCEVFGNSLRSGVSLSCGCLQLDYVKSNHNQRIHGGSQGHDRLYYVWNGMRQRCTYPGHNRYKHYGARGITFCEEWKNYENFRAWALSAGYDEKAARGKCTIDRIDVNGPYCPSNCRWVDSKVQAANRRRKECI